MSGRDRRPRPPKAAKPIGAEFAWAQGEEHAPAIAWRHDLRPLWAQVAPDAGVVALVSKKQLQAADLTTGRVRWTLTLPEEPEEIQGAADTLLVPLQRELWAVEAAQGGIVWRARPGGYVSHLAADRRTVYAAAEPSPGMGRAALVALEKPTGRTRWQTGAGEVAGLVAFPDADVVALLATSPDVLSIHEADTGLVRWRFEGGDYPLTLGDRVAKALFLASADGNVYAMDLATGHELWNAPGEDGFEAPPVAAEGRVLATDSRFVYAFDAASGRLHWKEELRGQLGQTDRVFSVYASAGRVYTHTWGGRLVALDAESGDVVWEVAVGNLHGLVTDPSGARLYVRSVLGEEQERWSILALQARTGAVDWEMHPSRAVTDLTRVRDLLVVELKESVIALRVGA